MTLKSWLNKSYPLIENSREKVLLVLGFSLFTWGFLLVYQPFGAAEIDENQPFFLLGFGISVGLGLFLSYFLLPLIFHYWFDREKWKIKKEIVYISFSVVLISVFNYLYNSTIGKEFAPQHSLFEFVGITFAVALFPLIIMIFLVERYLNKRNTADALRLNKQIEGVEEKKASVTLSIQPDTIKSGPLNFLLEDFLFATSDNNYVTLYLRREGETVRQLLRLSMKSLVEQLGEYQELKRCHRSYLVNKSKIKKFHGNARSLSLELEDYEGRIPVSRSYPKEELL